ncbi:hypothetical protein SISNIDRAFT_481720 [Sistotremastrum niveocremeum HHB9708]|uniref:RRM domain-containing protein n=1 Tax=Sistotremastrum niveocremeum HHB9708 TaxID=1314777 RepID=A0A164ZLA1_9AGAM|nr:hypothetical protein SISNIDRAFT_481720 [Sistotremastrum niveocremeum HHB9708]
MASDTSDSESSSSSSGESSKSVVEEAPVLSHAAKRRANAGKPVKGKQPVEAKPDLHGKPHRENSVWVGNLAFKTTPDALRNFFDGVGMITRIHMPTKATPANKWKEARIENQGFAYVDFETSDAKTVAITLSEGHLDGRKLLIKDGNDFTGRPAERLPSTAVAGEDPASSKNTGLSKTARKILSTQKQPPAQTLFVGNLSFQATADSLRAMVEAHRENSFRKDKKDQKDQKSAFAGEQNEQAEPEEEAPKPEPTISKKWLRAVRLGTFEDSGLCKGWAFLDFTSIEAATEALIDQRNHHMDGRALKLEYASPDAVRRGGGPRGNAPTKRPARAGAVPENETGDNPRKRKPETHDEHDPTESGKAALDDSVEPTSKRQRSDVKSKGPRIRPRPGAALALAKREKVGIVESLGEKIVFE